MMGDFNLASSSAGASAMVDNVASVFGLSQIASARTNAWQHTLGFGFCIYALHTR